MNEDNTSQTHQDHPVDFDFFESARKIAKKEIKESEPLKKEKRIKYQRQYNEDNREFIRQCQKRYNRTEKGKKANRRRNCTSHFRFRDLISDLSSEDLENIKNFYVNCPQGYEVDHIYPLSEGGVHHISNLQYLTKEDNREKGTKIDWEKL